ncbi:MAG: hypothetical protein JXB36_02965 [Gammaproteobacteria bacterium]|nr:hypothetical protein [Gammaproteobacteria bacterium]
MKPGVDPVVLRVVVRVLGFATMLVCELWLKDKLSAELYGRLYGLGGSAFTGTFVMEWLGQVDSVKLQKLADSMPPPPMPPSDETLQ